MDDVGEERGREGGGRKGEGEGKRKNVEGREGKGRNERKKEESGCCSIEEREGMRREESRGRVKEKKKSEKDEKRRVWMLLDRRDRGREEGGEGG